MVFAAPLMALALAGLATALNFGHQACVFMPVILLRSMCAVIHPCQMAQDLVAVVSGNRNLGLYFAALPADPLFSLFVAAYQIPIYLTPMVAAGLVTGQKSEIIELNRLAVNVKTCCILV